MRVLHKSTYQVTQRNLTSTMDFKPIILKRSKSECDLWRSHQHRRFSRGSESSAVDWSDDDDRGDRKDEIGLLERKIDGLSELFLEHCSLLADVRDEIRDANTLIEKSELAQNKFIAELLKNSLSTSDSQNEVSSSSDGFNERARTLLAAIETKQAFCLERELHRALVDFLQSDELKDHMVQACVNCLRAEVRGGFCRDVSQVYLPLLQRAHRQLAAQVARALHKGFANLEASTTQMSISMSRVSRSLGRAIEQHQAMLDGDVDPGDADDNGFRQLVEETLQKELQLWRQQAVAALCEDTYPEEWETERPASPELPATPQPPQPGCSPIDLLMKTAEINKLIEDGDVNTAFERALTAADLSLVVAACRAAEAAGVFSSGLMLTQATLLSLAQQLPTDMVHETQLKCRYLEEALIHLDPIHPATRTHLPLVVGEIRKHLTNFLSKYPNHVADRRIMLIIMAADNLLK